MEAQSLPLYVPLPSGYKHHALALDDTDHKAGPLQ